MAGYEQVKTGQWVKPKRKGYRMACCSCGCVHRLDFRLQANDHGPGKRIEFRAELDKRATAMVRRWMKKR